MATIELFHGSIAHDSILTVNSAGVFEGVFCSADQRVANSHAENVYRIELDEADICTSRDIAWADDIDAIHAMIKAKTWAETEEELDRAFEIICDADCEIEEDDIHLFDSSEDFADAGWRAQRVRGLAAKMLGFKAVEMRDEHGTTYLVLPGAELKAI